MGAQVTRSKSVYKYSTEILKCEEQNMLKQYAPAFGQYAPHVSLDNIHPTCKQNDTTGNMKRQITLNYFNNSMRKMMPQL